MSGQTETPGVVIRRDPGFAAALELAVAAGLEVSADAGEPLVLWGAYQGDRLAGIVSLDERDGLPVIGWIAVSAPLRGSGVGSLLLATAESEARRRGTHTLWADARAPGFFLKHGYEVVTAGEEREALLRDCDGCAQRGATCFPQAVRKALSGHH